MMRFKYESCESAVEYGDLEELKRMHSAGYQLTPTVACIAAEFDDIETLKYLRANNCEWDIWSTYNAAAYNNIKSLEYLHSNGCPWNSTVCKGAVKNNSYAAFKYLFENWSNVQDFWNIKFEEQEPEDMLRHSRFEQNLNFLIEQIDLDTTLWRQLLNIDTSKNPQINQKVNCKRNELNTSKQICENVLDKYIPKQVGMYMVFTYL